MTCDEEVRPDAPGVTINSPGYASVSYIPESQYRLGGLLSFDNVTDSTSSPYYASEVSHDNESIAISAANSPEKVDSPSWIPYPHGVLYKNLHHKFGSVLAMCKLS